MHVHIQTHAQPKHLKLTKLTTSSMSSYYNVPHQFYSDYTSTSTYFCDFPAPLTGGESFNVADNHGLFDTNKKSIEEAYFVPSLSSINNFSCPVFSDMAVPDFNTELSGIWNHGGGGYYGTELSDLSPCFSTAIVGGKCPMPPAIEELNTKVARYSVQERKDSIMRYLKKRNRRNFNKTIKYECRKTLADKRVRVRGRFARNDELCEEELSMIKTNNDNQQSNQLEFIDTGGDQNQYDDDWEVQWIEHLMSCSNHVGMFDETNMY